MNKVYGLILASGTGERTGLNIPKQFFKINDKTLLEMSIDAFEKNEFITDIIVVSHWDFIEETQKIIEKNNYKKVRKVIKGGQTRQQSSYNGVNEIPDGAKVLIHDAVRPFVTQKIITDCVKALEKYNAAGVAIPCTDTIIQVGNNLIENIPKRETLMQIQTPQAFKVEIIKKAHEYAKEHPEIKVTDDCGLIKSLNLCDIFVVEGDVKNIKITYPKDLKIAKNCLY